MPARPPANLRERLRMVTREAHLRLEAEVDFDNRLASLAAYRSFLEDFYRFVQPLEKAFAKLDLASLGIDSHLRRKLPWIEADLKDLGHTAESLANLPEFNEVPAFADPLDALGALYVLEGSSLGRQVMLLKLRARLGIGAARAGRFFSGYGNETGQTWQSFVTILNNAGSASPSAALRIEAAALATFAAFEKCLAQGRLRDGTLR